jgi:cytoplasmic iron level regulating protein YaaA (DUF328/UPF0246 family)
VLLPPSEGKATGGDGEPWSPEQGIFGSELGASRHRVIAALAADGGGTAKLLGVGGKHLDRAQRANQALCGAETLPAWQRYTGVVWDHLDPGTLAARQRNKILVVSGLLGLLGAEDPIPDYRLKVGASLAPLGKLSSWWRPQLTAALGAHARRRFIIDLLPNEHRAGVDTSGMDGVAVVFRHRSGASAGHAAKAAKGHLARHLLTFDGAADEALGSWRDDQFELEVTPL